MKTTELRIGNWVYDSLGNIIEVEGLTKNGVIINGEVIGIENFKPIKLESHNLWMYNFKSIGKDFVRKGFFIHVRKSGLNLKKGVDINYLHTLQNLYFDIIKEELMYGNR